MTTRTASRARPSRVRKGRLPEPPAPPAPRRRGPTLELDTVASAWQLALDDVDRALSAAANSLAPDELTRRRRALEQERRQTAGLLADVARTARVRPAPWLSPVPVTNRMLGLPEGVGACLFDLDGVLTDSGRLHALAWASVFDAFLLSMSERAGWSFIPFDTAADYRAYVDGRPRLEGVHAFLDSRGIRIPEGRPGDPAGSETAYGLAAQKSALVRRELSERGVIALPGARRYLEATGHAGVKRAVVSASAHARAMLERAGLTTVVEERVDAEVIERERLRARPAPDLVLSACRRLGIPPERAVTFTHSPAGVAAGHAAGVIVIGVGADADGELLRGFGAEEVVPSLAGLLDRQLAAR